MKECLDYSTLKDALLDLPESLDETYARILRRIPKEHKRQATTILRFLVWSDRPVRHEEMVDAIAVRVDEEPCFKPINRMPEPTEILRYCPGLVDLRTSTANQYQGNSSRPAHGKELHLTHLSVKEYLMTRLANQVTDMILTESVAKASLAVICLKYLTHINRFPSTREIRARFVFSEYCARYWASFAILGEHVDPSLQSLISSSLEDSKWMFATLWHYSDEDKQVLDQVESVLLPQPNALCCATMKGLSMTTTLLLRKLTGTEPQYRSRLLDAALWVATHQNHKIILQTLLRDGADPNIMNEKIGTFPLELASAAGHEETVRMLLDGGADLVKVGDQTVVALHEASAKGQRKVVELLLERGAIVDLRVTDKVFPHETALAAAIFGKHSDVALTLLDHNADANLRCGDWDNAIQAASFYGLERVVKKLLDSSDTAKDGYGGALQAASFNGNDRVVSMLLQHGVEVNAQGFKYGSPLRAAALSGNDKIVRLLLRDGAVVNDSSNSQGKALNTALPEDNKSIADALDAAISEHKETIVQTLLEHGSAVTLNNIVKALSLYSRISVTMLLPYLTLEMMSQNDESKSMNVLHWAAKTDSQEAVRRCLELGADVHSRDRDGMTALHHAAKDGNLEVVRLLVEGGSDVLGRDHGGLTPLLCADARMRACSSGSNYMKARKTDIEVYNYLDRKAPKIHR